MSLRCLRTRAGEEVQSKDLEPGGWFPVPAPAPWAVPALSFIFLTCEWGGSDRPEGHRGQMR